MSMLDVALDPSHPPQPQVLTWTWRGFSIRYQQAASHSTGSALILIHGFGASSDHWRKNIPELGRHHRVYALDLIGFGGSAKPAPVTEISYSFETWAAQVLDFSREVIEDPAVLVGNSIGCIVALQAAVSDPDQVLGIAMLDCSLRLLHDRKRSSLSWLRRTSTPVIQSLLGNRTLGHFFFQQLARPHIIRNILREAYGRKEAVTPELLDLLLKPAQDPGAADVFLAFVRYSQGPLPEELLPQVRCPVTIGWGEVDPWEPVALGRELATADCVESFTAFAGVGHCPQDEAPELINPWILDWLGSHAWGSATG